MVGLGVGIGQFFGGAEDTRQQRRPSRRRKQQTAGRPITRQRRRWTWVARRWRRPNCRRMRPWPPPATMGARAARGIGPKSSRRRRPGTLAARRMRVSKPPGLRTPARTVPEGRPGGRRDARLSPQPSEAPREFYDVTLVTVPSDAAVYRGRSKMRSRTPMKLKVRPGRADCAAFGQGGAPGPRGHHRRREAGPHGAGDDEAPQLWHAGRWGGSIGRLLEATAVSWLWRPGGRWLVAREQRRTAHRCNLCSSDSNSSRNPWSDCLPFRAWSCCWAHSICSSICATD